jgi:MDMPI-like protein
VDFVAAIRRDATALLDLCARDSGRLIRSCPGWVARDLQDHIVETLRGQIPGFAPTDENAGTTLQQALELLELDPSPARDIANECAVHRWDASDAFGVEYAVESDLACDGVDEFFEAAWPIYLKYFERRAGAGETLHLHRTDGDGEWLIVLDELPRVTHEHAESDAGVAGTASDLLLWLWGRMDPPEVTGDRDVLERIRNPRGRFLSPGF